MNNRFIIFAFVCTLASQVQCSLTERLSVASSQIAMVKADAKAGGLDAKCRCEGSMACKTLRN